MINYKSDEINPLTIELCKIAIKAQAQGYANTIKLMNLAIELIESSTDNRESNVIEFHKFEYKEYNNCNDNVKHNNPYVA